MKIVKLFYLRKEFIFSRNQKGSLPMVPHYGYNSAHLVYDYETCTSQLKIYQSIIYELDE